MGPIIFPTSPFPNNVLTHSLISLFLLLLLPLFTILHYSTSINQAFSFLPFSFSFSHLSNGRWESCDYSEGKWVSNGASDLYYSEECPFLDPGFLCRFNGREDLRYLQWRWKPRSCNLPSGNYFQIGDAINMTMDVKEAYRRTVRTIKRWAEEKLHRGKNFVFFRSYSPAHYSNGAWETNGNCDNETEPNIEEKKLPAEPWSNRVTSEVFREGEHDKKVSFLNITYLTEQRSDGHPSKHRQRGTRVGAPQDCSHWCLPGVPDTWNEILLAELFSMGYGT